MIDFYFKMIVLQLNRKVDVYLHTHWQSVVCSFSASVTDIFYFFTRDYLLVKKFRLKMIIMKIHDVKQINLI